ncbi:cation diffusion facilitator family transporter [Entomobacter blattae]|uniref:Zinc transporter ZitB n=1 Tax=Entomobacter blattae TaxID=2762277 RepID=A0A7H1NQT7_9PROT|nr:cation diffusion facilitator family transporter [Entomobacter blattae]QNT78147.1 Zinc transporter ZitB [Entomobacter blattae]
MPLFLQPRPPAPLLSPDDPAGQSPHPDPGQQDHSGYHLQGKEGPQDHNHNHTTHDKNFPHGKNSPDKDPHNKSHDKDLNKAYDNKGYGRNDNSGHDREHDNGYDNEHNNGYAENHSEGHHHDHPHNSPENHDDHGHDEHTPHSHHTHTHGVGHHHVHAPTSFGRAFALGIIINSLYIGIETLWGLFAGSLALLADAGHNLSDVLALAVAWTAEVLSRRKPSNRYTYGLRRSSILASLANALLLVLVTGGIIWEAILRLFNPQPVASLTVMIVAGLGILVNGGTAMLFMAGQKEDLNIRGAFLHMAADALMSLAVVIGGGIIYFTQWLWLDPAISLGVSAAIILATWSLLRYSLDMALDAVPPGIDFDEIAQFLRSYPGIMAIHDLHIWPMSTTETALTAHLVYPGPAEQLSLSELAHQLRLRFKIDHATFQVETEQETLSCTLDSNSTV